MNGLLLFDDEKDERFYTNNELLEHWQRVRDLASVEHLDIRRNELRSFENYDRILGDYDFVLNAWFTSDNMRHELFEHHPKLKYMSTYSHGWEEFDLEFVKKRGVVLTNTVYGATTIAEHGKDGCACQRPYHKYDTCIAVSDDIDCAFKVIFSWQIN